MVPVRDDDAQDRLRLEIAAKSIIRSCHAETALGEDSIAMQDIDALRRSVDLARLISDHGVELKPAGPGKQSGLCPFHRERTPSFGVFRGEDGAQRFHCFGCNAGGDVLDWLKLTQGLDTRRAIEYLGGGNGATPHPAPPTPAPVERKPWADPAGRRIAAVWDYTDAAGTLLYQQVRIEPGKNGRSKDFQTRSPNPAGGFWFGMGDAERVLWNLPSVLQAAEVWIVEGEKDAANLMSAGIPCATTNSHGADGWRQSLAAPLAGKTVYVCGDTDGPGLARDARILRDVAPIAAAVYLVRLPEGCKDASEWLEAGQSVEALRKLAKLVDYVDTAPINSSEPSTADVDAALAGIPPGDPPPPAGPDDSPDLRWLNQTDSGNGERLIAMFGPLVAYTAEMKSWMAFDAIQWQIDDVERACNYARVTMREFYRQAEDDPKMDSDTKKSALKWGRRSESANGIASMMRMARTLPGVTISASQLDRNPMLLNLQNGTFDLERFELREHRREDFITKLAPVAYLPDAQCPNWIRFLNRIFDGREDVIRYLQRALGYTLTGSVQEKAMFCLFGDGDNGKTTLLEAIRAVMGDYSSQILIETLMARAGAENNATLADLADLRGSRFVTTSEGAEGASLNEARLKYLTGNGEIRACRKYENHIAFMPSHKLWMESNHRPVVRGADKAVWARLKPIGLTVSIPKSEQDPELRGRLIREASGILRWMLDGYRDWTEIGLGTCPDMDADLDKWQKESDPLEEFFEEHCEAGAERWVSVVTMRKAYDKWAEDNGHQYTLSPQKFNRLMEARGFRRVVRRTGVEVLKAWEGVSVRSSMWNM